MDALDELEKRTESTWEHLRLARKKSMQENVEITSALRNYPTADASVVVVGSLARE